MGIGREDVDYESVDTGAWTLRDDEVKTFVSTATRTVASLVRSTFGPNGRTALIETLDNVEAPETVHTSDANEILAAIQRGGGFGHPVAALFIDSVDAMQRELRDGTTSTVVLTDALVDSGMEAIEAGIHPGNVVVGYSMAAARTGSIFDSLSREVVVDDQVLLEWLAVTSMTTDIPDRTRKRYAKRVAEVVYELAQVGDTGWIDTNDAKVLANKAAEGGCHRGVVVRRYPGLLEESEKAEREFDWSTLDPMTDATVAIIDSGIDFEQSATSFGEDNAGVEIDSFEQWRAYTDGLNQRISAAADRFTDLGVDVLVSQERIERPTRAAFESRGVTVVDEVQYPLVDVYRLARATGAIVVDTLSDLTADCLGSVGSLTERRVGDEKWTFFDDCRGGVFSLVVDVETETAGGEHEQLLENALEVTATAATDGQALPGAGAAAMAAATDLRRYATSVADVEQLAIEAFANSLESVPLTLAENAGVDRIDALTALRSAHACSEGPSSIGLSPAGEPFDAWEAGVVEPRRVFSQAIETSRTIAEQLLTVDAVLHPGVDIGEFDPRTESD